MLTNQEILKLVSEYLNKDIKQEFKEIRKYINLKTREHPKLEHSAYSNDKYLLGAIACYFDYSKKYLKILKKINTNLELSFSVILELGAGCGLTTLHLHNDFPDSKIIYNNLSGKQYDFAKFLFDKSAVNIQMIPDFNNIKEKVDLVIATDFFEHLSNAMEVISTVINNTNPNYLLIANAFNLKHPDHFQEFIVNEKKIKNTQMPRIFNSYLRKQGYSIHQVSNAIWNKRPTFWYKAQINIPDISTIKSDIGQTEKAEPLWRE